jgi:transcriptional regulator with GAF, ATPase, and Fis domain
MQRLQSYPWPGNIRELENVIERAIILADGSIIEISPEMLLGSIEQAVVPTDPKQDSTLESVERQHIRSVLEQANWVIEGPNGAARTLALHPSTLRYRMKKLGLAPERR